VARKNFSTSSSGAEGPNARVWPIGGGSCRSGVKTIPRLARSPNLKPLQNVGSMRQRVRSAKGSIRQRFVPVKVDCVRPRPAVADPGRVQRALSRRTQPSRQRQQAAFPIWRSVGTAFLRRQGRRVEPQFLQGPNRCEVLVNARWLDQIGRDLLVIGPGDINVALAAANSYNWYSS
jgi:hypothetical protein